MDPAPHDDPERWALTWRAYRRKSEAAAPKASVKQE
jgi:hypothetical protein